MVDKDEIDELIYRYFENAMTEEALTDDQYVIGEDGSVEVQADVGRKRNPPDGLLPVKFSYVDGDFLVPEMRLISLHNCPQTVNGKFDCSRNRLKNLDHAPTAVHDFDCSYNQLTSLKGCPHVPGELVCNNNLLESLESCPPADLVWATNNPFKHFRNTPSHIRSVTITWNPNLPLLGLLVVKDIDILDPESGQHMPQLDQIIKKYAGQGLAGSFACAHELEVARWKGNAAW